MCTLPLIPNATARRIFLDRHLLATAPTGEAKGAALRALIEALGFVQIDSIATVERAHHMILFSRRHTYRPTHLTPLLERDRVLWEHWTHDAAILPVTSYPHWHHRFQHNRETLVQRWTGWQKPGFEAQFDRVLHHIAAQGASAAADLGEKSPGAKSGWWDWQPSKAALEYLWQSGALAISHRVQFRKHYDLAERVIPAELRAARPSRAETIDWACRSALDRLGFATAKELAAFWHLVSLREAQDWCAQTMEGGQLCQAMIAPHPLSGAAPKRIWLWPETRHETPRQPPGMIRILSPFDPVLRDRARAEFLFGFHYRIEIYVPEKLRRYGYYVFPLLEGDRLIGRIDAKAYRAEGRLHLRALWPQHGVTFGRARLKRLDTALRKLAAFAGCDRLDYAADLLRAAETEA